MPIYQYYCEACNISWKEIHGPEDKSDLCKDCGSEPKRNIPTYSIINKTNNMTAGKRVEKYIEETKEIVKEQLNDARREYKP